MLKIQILAILLFSTVASWASEFTREGQLILVDPTESFYYFDLENSNLTPVHSQAFDGTLSRMVSDKDKGAFDQSQCTGSIVALPGYQPSDKALVLTAGHCLQLNGTFLPSKKAMLNEPYLDSELHFNLRGSKKINLPKVVFAAFDALDLALLETDVTYAELDGGTPPQLSMSDFEPGKGIRILGVPQDWKFSSNEFHESRCQMQKLTEPVNKKFNNTEEVYAVTGRIAMNCTAFRGMSGGPVKIFDGSIVGVITNAVGNSFNLFSPIDPILGCVNGEGRFSFTCLSELKQKIENR